MEITSVAMKKCLTCDQLKDVAGGLTDSDNPNLLQCKDCLLAELCCLECELPSAADKRILFDEGDGKYYSICHGCLERYYTLLCLLKDQKPDQCLRTVKEAFEIADNAISVDLKDKRTEPVVELIFDDNGQTRKQRRAKNAMLTAQDLILGVEAETLIMVKRDGCPTRLDFSTSDYTFEFNIGCHGGTCTYIDVQHSDAMYVIQFFDSGEVDMCWKGKAYNKFPEWMSIKAMKDHCDAIIKKLQVPPCKSWH